MAPGSFGEVIAGNIRAARSRAQLDQAVVVGRMRDLGYVTWHRQTLGKIERGERRVLADELMGLAAALEISITGLLSPTEKDGDISFPDGRVVDGVSVQRWAGRGVFDHAVQWPDNGTHAWVMKLSYPPGASRPDPFDRTIMGAAMAAQGWPEDAEVPPDER